MSLPFQVWCKCGHISGQHGVAPPHRCATGGIGGCKNGCTGFERPDCEECGETPCAHGICECSEDICIACWKRKQDELDAEREANFQRNVIGFGETNER